MTNELRLETLKGVGPSILAKLNKAQIHTTTDLLLHLPKDYQDRRVITPIKEAIEGKKQQFEGVIRQVNASSFGKNHLTCYISDGESLCKMHLFRYYPNQLRLLRQGQAIRLFGEVQINHHQVELIHPEWQIINSNTPSQTGEITPIYSGIDNLKSPSIYKIIKQLQDKVTLTEHLPADLLHKWQLLDINTALNYLHFPDNKNFDDLHNITAKAQYRLALEEMLAHHLHAKITRQNTKTQDYFKIRPDYNVLKKFTQLLPFTPTNAQSRVIEEIFCDFTLEKPLSRLVQGDVGSGKTVIAAATLIQCALNNYQSVLMAPTEILAEQHFNNLKNWLSDFGINCIFMAQKLSTKQRKQALKDINQYNNCVVIGTHAVFQETMHYPNLGLVIIDEQHRFGVEQRLTLMEKAKSKQRLPHQIVMTATPIPRTLAMTVYGDLDLSIIDELPPNRKPITTSVINQDKKQQLIEKLQHHIEQAGQAYWVCPLIESSETLTHLQDAQSLYEMVQALLPKSRVDLIHGKLKAQQKTDIMLEFKAHKLDILVATTVIEVGVDVPNANIMVIDNAERLGLSQLHQLRGRVGRGSKTSNCVLLYQAPLSITAKKRLALMRETQDGFIIAEEDLKLRGPGDIFGKNQTGSIQFRVADLSMHQQLFDDIRAIADYLLLHHRQNAYAITQRWLETGKDYIKA